jgi:hypothetical protein
MDHDVGDFDGNAVEAGHCHGCIAILLPSSIEVAVVLPKSVLVCEREPVGTRQILTVNDPPPRKA